MENSVQGISTNIGTYLELEDAHGVVLVGLSKIKWVVYERNRSFAPILIYYYDDLDPIVIRPANVEKAYKQLKEALA